MSEADSQSTRSGATGHGSHHAVDDQLAAEQFTPADYIRERLRGVRTGDETRKLQTLRSEMSAINSASSEMLKNNVFQNYQQFIDSSKEISHLEREIYQLSSLLLDQKQLIESLIQMTGDDKTSIHTVSSHTTTASANNVIQMLVQKMDGIAGILNNLRSSDRVVLHSEMELLDAETKQPVQRALLVLLNDRLLVGSHAPGGKFTLESTFSLNNVAAVNVRDRESGDAGSADKMIKLLIFPEQRYYRCESARVKKLWLDEMEQLKRELLHEGGMQRQATIRGKRKTVKERMASASPALPSARLAEEDEDDTDKNGEMNEVEAAWLAELPAELDDCIAHRDLDSAVELILEWKSCELKEPTADAQIAAREKQIVSLLSDDVRRPGAVHGGPRAMKKARTLLTQLGRGTYAVDIYLRRRGALVRQAMRDVAVAEEPLSYVRQLTALFYQAVGDIASEFLDQTQYYCQVLQWCSSELSVLLSLVRRHVIEVAPTMAVLAYTWRILMQMCDDLSKMGVQLTFMVHRLLGASLSAALESDRVHTVQSMKNRMADERWRPNQLDSDSALSRLLEELSDVGLSADWATAADQPTLNISPNTLHFTSTAHALAKHLGVFLGSPLRATCESYALELWRAYLSHLDDADTQSVVHPYSTTFVVTQVLPLCDQLLSEEDSRPLLDSLLRSEFPQLLKYVASDEEEDDEEEEVAHV